MHSNFKNQGPRTKFQEPSSNLIRARPWNLVLGIWNLVLGIWFFVVLVGLGLSSQNAVAADRPAKIQQAIDRGVAFLKSIQSEDGMWHYIPPGGISTEQNVGATALAGLTLLECDVPPSDPAVQKAAEVVRQHSISCGYTYALSLSIMFLDRLDEEADVRLIQSMTIRLLAGQTAAGGWIYTCPPTHGDEVRRLTDLVQKRNELKGGREMPKKKKLEDGAKIDLPKEIQDQLNKLRPPAAVNPQQMAGNAGQDALLALSGVEGDNSNTQFAALALWVARRSGMPVEEALARIERRFRRAQHQDGGWTYLNTTATLPGNWSFPPAMTCAGLIGLAVGQGVGKNNKDLNKDPNIVAGFTNLANHLQILSNVSAIGQGEKGFYFLWSLERMAEVYGLKMIGKTDWYRWASQVLLNSQQANGGFYGEYANGGVDTCFALLVLSRANVAKDLARNLRGRLKDGVVTLRSGGVGREGLENLAKKPGDKSDKANSSDSKPVDPTGKLGSGSVPIEEEDVEARAARMSNELAKADPGRQAEMFEKYQEGKGSVYTLALAGAIPRLGGDAKSKAREALAQRLTRMTAATLRQELKDDDPEIRRAAALACAMKDDKSHVPDLIPLLEDREPIVGRAAHAALKNLSGKDFGPEANASRRDTANAVAAWKGWWDKTQTEKNPGK
jgi:hypothetical protein